MTKQEKIDAISELVYNKLNYMYCDNCRYNLEIDEEDRKAKGLKGGCEDCYRKYNGWGISKNKSMQIARDILNVK